MAERGREYFEKQWIERERERIRGDFWFGGGQERLYGIDSI